MKTDRFKNETGSGTILALAVVILLIFALSILSQITLVVSSVKNLQNLTDMSAIAALTIESKGGIQKGEGCKNTLMVAESNRATLAFCEITEGIASVKLEQNLSIIFGIQVLISRSAKATRKC